VTGPGTLSRRALVRFCALLPVAGLPFLPGCSRTSSSCVDPALLSRGEEQMRKTRAYVDTSTVANQDCANCQFFSADADGACGHCEILDGPVSRGGHCTAWAGA